MAKGLCETCGVADDRGNPCHLMLRETAEVSDCGAYIKDIERHAELVAGPKVAKKTKAGAEKGVTTNV